MRKPGAIRSVALPLGVVAVMMVIWTIVWRSGIFHPSAFPAPLAVLRGFIEEARTGRLFTDLITSLFRVTCGFSLAVVTGVQVVTTLRVTAGVCWLVVVAAEMIAGRDGLGFAVMDARNGLRTDILVVEMIVIGLVGVGIDRALEQLTKIPSIRWGYER